MSEEFDLYSEATIVKTPSAVLPALKLISRRKGPLATIIASTTDYLSMDIVSVVDHITEPRDVVEYSIRPNGSLIDDGYTLHRNYPGYHAVLGWTTDRQGAENLLQYLKESA